MTYHMKLEKHHIPKIEKLLAEGLCDREIGIVLGGFSKNQVYSFRYRNFIDAKFGRGTRKRERRKPEEIIIHPLRQIIENGIQITIYPAMWARGIRPQKNIMQRD